MAVKNGNSHEERGYVPISIPKVPKKGTGYVPPDIPRKPKPKPPPPNPGDEGSGSKE